MNELVPIGFIDCLIVIHRCLDDDGRDFACTYTLRHG